MRVGSTLAVVACTLAIAGGMAGANSTSLNLVTRPPDISSTVDYMNYDPGSCTFTAIGTPANLDLENGLHYTVKSAGTAGKAIDISMTQDPETGEFTKGEVTIIGKVGQINATSGTLLTGTLFRFGYYYGGSESTFEFIFAVTGGDLADRFGPTAGVILDAGNTGFTGTFASSFGIDSGHGFGFSDTFAVVPEPLTALGVLLGAGSLAGYLRRRNA